MSQFALTLLVRPANQPNCGFRLQFDEPADVETYLSPLLFGDDDEEPEPAEKKKVYETEEETPDKWKGKKDYADEETPSKWKGKKDIQEDDDDQSGKTTKKTGYDDE